jgi:hypothetical protein
MFLNVMLGLRIALLLLKDTLVAADSTKANSESFLDCLLSRVNTNVSFFKPQQVDISDNIGMKNIDTGAYSKGPVKIVGNPYGLWNEKLWKDKMFSSSDHDSCKQKANTTNNIDTYDVLNVLVSKYGNDTVKWHFAGAGNEKLPLLTHSNQHSQFIPLKKVVQIMLHQQQQNQREPQKENSTKPLPQPSYFHVKMRDRINITTSKNSCADPKHMCCTLMYHQLSKLNLINQTPSYAIASTGGFMQEAEDLWAESENNQTVILNESEVKELKSRFHPELTQNMRRDRIFSSKTVKDKLSIFKRPTQDIDLYFATKMSGSHAHTHGASVTSTTGKKLWMFYSPKMFCRLLRRPDAFRQAGLLPLCPELKGEKFNPKIACLGQLHPIELINAYEAMLELGIAPILLVQYPNEILVVPDHWVHATINLEVGISVAFKFYSAKEKDEHFCDQQIIITNFNSTTIPHVSTKYHLSYNSIFKQHWGFHEPPSLFDLGIRKQIEQAVNEENYELAEKIARDCIRECSDVVYEDVSILLCDALFNQKKMQEYVEWKALSIPYTAPLQKFRLRVEMRQYLLALFQLGLSEAYHHVFRLVARNTGWIHQFQIPIFLESGVYMKELDGYEPVPFHESGNFNVLNQLEEIFPIIQHELSSLISGVKGQGLEKLFQIHHESNLIHSGMWQVIPLFDMLKGMWSKAHCKLLPLTCKALQGIKAFTIRIVESETGQRLKTKGVPGELNILILLPTSRLIPHTGSGNTRLTIQMGLHLPPKNTSWLSCGNTTRHLQVGKALIFDDSFIHSAGNEHSTKPRIIFSGHFFKHGVCIRNRCVIPQVHKYGLLKKMSKPLLQPSSFLRKQYDDETGHEIRHETRQPICWYDYIDGMRYEDS